MDKASMMFLCIDEFIEKENPKAAHKVISETYALASNFKTMVKRFRTGTKAQPIGSDRKKTILELLQ